MYAYLSFYSTKLLLIITLLPLTSCSKIQYQAELLVYWISVHDQPYLYWIIKKKHQTEKSLDYKKKYVNTVKWSFHTGTFHNTVVLLIKEVDRLMQKLAGLKHVFISQKERFNSLDLNRIIFFLKKSLLVS